MGSHCLRTRSEAHRVGKGGLHLAPDFFLPSLIQSGFIEILTEHLLCDRCSGELKTVMC